MNIAFDRLLSGLEWRHSISCARERKAIGRRSEETRPTQSIPSLERHEPSFMVTHRVPGRLRLRVPELARRPMLAPRIESILLTLDAVHQVRCNPACASVVLYHRGPRAPARVDMARALATVMTPCAHGGALVAVPRVDTGVGKGCEPRRRDCLLCRIKLALVRLIVKDLWRCWRLEQGLLDRPGRPKLEGLAINRRYPAAS